jgi:hypothetical protein
MSNFQRIRALYRRPLRLGTKRISNSATGTLVDMDDPIVRRDMYRHLGNWASVGDVVIQKYTYDYSRDGGAIGAITLLDEAGKAQKLPENALILGAWLEGVTAPTAAAGATIALGTTGTPALFKAATIKTDATFLPDAISTAAAAVPAKIVASGGENVKATVAVSALTAGKLDLYVQLVLGV